MTSEFSRDLYDILTRDAGRYKGIEQDVADRIVCEVVEEVETFRVMRLAQASIDLEVFLTRWLPNELIPAIERLESMLTESRALQELFSGELPNTVSVAVDALRQLKAEAASMVVPRVRHRPVDFVRRAYEANIGYILNKAGLRVTQAPDGLFARVLQLVYAELDIPEGDMSHALKQACRLLWGSTPK